MTANRLADAVRDAHHAVHDLATEVRRLGERHAADHDVLHLSRTLGLKLDQETHRLAGQGERLGRHLADVEPDPERDGGLFSGLRERTAKVFGSRPAAGILLLVDLRGFLAQAADASVACVILAQGANAAGDTALLEAANAAKETVDRTHRWALTRLKVTAPQVLNGP